MVTVGARQTEGHHQPLDSTLRDRRSRPRSRLRGTTHGHQGGGVCVGEREDEERERRKERRDKERSVEREVQCREKNTMGHGLLEVHQVHAKGLSGSDFLGKIDSYVVVQYRSARAARSEITTSG